MSKLKYLWALIPGAILCVVALAAAVLDVMCWVAVYCPDAANALGNVIVVIYAAVFAIYLAAVTIVAAILGIPLLIVGIKGVTKKSV